MAQDILDSWNKLSQTAFESAQKLSEANVKITEKLMEEQINLANSLIETCSKNIESVGKAKGVQDVLSSQSATAQECGQQVLKSCRSYANALSEARDVYSKLFEQNVAAASKNFKADGKKAA